MLANEFISLCGLSDRVANHENLIAFLVEYIGSESEDKETLWSNLPWYVQQDILSTNDLSTAYPYPWSGSKAVKKLVKNAAKSHKGTYSVLHFDAGWSVDQLRKLDNLDIICLEALQGEDLSSFLNNHHSNVLTTLLASYYITSFDVGMETQEVWSIYYFTQAVETWNWLYRNYPKALKGIRVRDVESYYRKLNKLKIDLEPIYSLPVNKELSKMLGSSFQDYKIEFPEDSYMLKQYGHKLDHCVGSYGERILKGECSIVSLNDKNNEPVYTVEFLRGDRNIYFINQFMGYKDVPASRELRSKLERLLVINKLKEQVSRILFYKLW